MANGGIITGPSAAFVDRSHNEPEWLVRDHLYSVEPTPYLPIDETAPATDLETRVEIRYPTGRKIHCMRVDNKVYLSQVMFDKLKAYKPA